MNFGGNSKIFGGSSQPAFSIGKIDIKKFITEHTRLSFFSIIDELLGDSKILVISETLLSKFSFFFTTTDLVCKGFEKKIFLVNKNQALKDYLRSTKPNSKRDLVFVIENSGKTLSDIKSLQLYINKMKLAENYEIFLVFAPRISAGSAYFLEKCKDKIFTRCFNFGLDLIPLCDDVISLEDYSYFTSLISKDDEKKLVSKLFDAIRNKILRIFQRFNLRFSKGNLAIQLKNLIDEAEEKDKNTVYKQINSNVCNSIIIFDRKVDMLTPLCSQLTYRGAIDDFYSVKLNQNLEIEIEVNEESNNIAASSIVNFSKLVIPLNDENVGYNQVKDLHLDEASNLIQSNFFEAKQFLNQVKKEGTNSQISGINDPKSSISKSSVSDNMLELSENLKIYNEYNKKYKSVKDLVQLTYSLVQNSHAKQEAVKIETDLLINGSKSIVDVTSFFEALVNQHISKTSSMITKESKDKDKAKAKISSSEELVEALRILCLTILSKDLNMHTIKSHFNLYLLKNEKIWLLLEEFGILKRLNPNIKNGGYEFIISEYNLIVDEFSKDHIAFPYNGYIPILVKLIKEVLTKGWIKSKMLKYLFGYNYSPSNEVLIRESSGYIVVVFIGGITYSEISAIRLLNKHKCMEGRQIIILTTGIINCNHIPMQLLSWIS